MTKVNFDQRLECPAPKHWSKYTTSIISASVNFTANILPQILKHFVSCWNQWLIDGWMKGWFWKEPHSSILMLFYYLAPCKMTLSWHHDAFSSLLETRKRFTCWTRVPYLWLKKKVCERGKEASALGWNMDMQTLVHFALIQMNGSAYSTFHLSLVKLMAYFDK